MLKTLLYILTFPIWFPLACVGAVLGIAAFSGIVMGVLAVSWGLFLILFGPLIGKLLS